MRARGRQISVSRLFGHGSGSNLPNGTSCPLHSAATSTNRPRLKQLISRPTPPFLVPPRATCCSGSASSTGTASVASASHPPLTTHHVATASTNHSRSARATLVIFVACHCQPPRLLSL